MVWQNVKQGVCGNGETAAVAYTIPEGSVSFWQNYLESKRIPLHSVEQRFGTSVLPLDDPDGMRIEIIESYFSAEIRYWEDGPIPQAHALKASHTVTLWLGEIEPTADLLVNQMGYTFAGQEGNRHRFVGGSGFLASTLDILHRPVQAEDILAEAVLAGDPFTISHSGSQPVKSNWNTSPGCGRQAMG